MKYVVELRGPIPGDRERLAQTVAEAFNIPFKKAYLLMKRAPGVVTKPISEREAKLVSSLFRKVGLSAEMQVFDATLHAATVPVAAAGGAQPRASATAPAAGGGAESYSPPPSDASTGASTGRPRSPLLSVVEEPAVDFSRGQVAPVGQPAEPAEQPQEPEGEPKAPVEAAAAEIEEVASEVVATEAVSGETVSEVPVTEEVAEKSVAAKHVVRPATPSMQIGLLPAALALAVVVAAAWLPLLASLRSQLDESARNLAVAFAYGLQDRVSADALASAEGRQGLQTLLEASKFELRPQNTRFVVITDSSGIPVVGWYDTKPTVADLPADVLLEVQAQAQAALAGTTSVRTAASPLSTFSEGLFGGSGGIAAEVVPRGGAAEAAVVVGLSRQGVNQQVQTGILLTVLVGLVVFAVIALTARGVRSR